jgi:hypothetical protein
MPGRRGKLFYESLPLTFFAIAESFLEVMVLLGKIEPDHFSNSGILEKLPEIYTWIHGIEDLLEGVHATMCDGGGVHRGDVSESASFND